MDSKPTVCVTGATGMLAAFVVQQLLQRGYTVRGTVRDSSNERRVRPLKHLEGAQHQLSLWDCDLSTIDSKPEQFALALKGCSALIHTATPLFIPLSGSAWASSEATGVVSAPLSEIEAQELQIKPATSGTLRLLELAASAGVKTVVLTSSNASMSGLPKFDIPNAPSVMNAECWSDLDWCRAHQKWYRIAKTEQERIAREFCSATQLQFACINPDAIWGPTLTPHLNLSHAVLLEMLDGTMQQIPNSYIGAVDVRDVALAHVHALERLIAGQQLSGRYLMTFGFWHFQQVAEFLRAEYPWAKVPIEEAPVGELGCKAVPPTADCGAVEEELGVPLRSMEEILRATVEALLKDGHLVRE